MKIQLLVFIIIVLILYLIYFLYCDYIQDDILLSNGLTSHLLEDNGQKALNYYNKTDSYEKQERMANIYFYGTKNTRKDYDKALLYYKRVFLYDPDNKNIKSIREKINHITKYKLFQLIQNQKDSGINNNYHENILNDNINNYINKLSNEDLNSDINIDIDFINNNIINEDIKNIEDSNAYKKNDDTHIQDDKESAHDSGINNTIKISFDKLKNNVILNYSFGEIYKKILNDLYDSDFNEIDQFKIRSVLKEITKKQDFIVNNISLKECLTVVGNRIYIQDNKETIKIILLNLFNELNDCVKDTGELICLIGISNRIINCLNIVDELVTIKPTWAIREELMRRCCSIRKNLEKRISSTNIDFNEKLKNEIITVLKKEYVHSNNIMSLDDFNKEINSWIEYI